MKNKYTTIGIVIATIILAGVAIFTAIRLYETRDTAVAPNVPSSKPAAYDNSCSLSFTQITEGTLFCDVKEIYKGDSLNSEGTYDTSAGNKIAPGSTVLPNQKIVFVVKIGPEATSKNFTIVDRLSDKVTFLDSRGPCTYTASNHTVSCTADNTNMQTAYRVIIKSDATGTIENTAELIGDAGAAPSICTTNVVLQSTATATATATTTATATATTTATATATSVATRTATATATATSVTTATATSVATRTATATATATSVVTATATATSVATPTPTIVATPTQTSTSIATVTATATAVPQCNYSCTSNTQCPNDLICYIPSGSTTGNCRNTQCLLETDCVCAVPATATATSVAIAAGPTQPSLPDAGTSWPTILGATIGVLVILGSLLLVL